MNESGYLTLLEHCLNITSLPAQAEVENAKMNADSLLHYNMFIRVCDLLDIYFYTDTDDCSNTSKFPPCKNGATCIDGINARTCRCVPGFDPGPNGDCSISKYVLSVFFLIMP